MTASLIDRSPEGIAAKDCVEIKGHNFVYDGQIGRVTQVCDDSFDGWIAYIRLENGRLTRCQTHKLVKHNRQVCGEE